MLVASPFFSGVIRDPQPINEIIPSALGIHIIDTQHKIVMSIATHTAILDMILAWLKGSNSERKVSIGIITELLFYTKELGVEEQELIVKPDHAIRTVLFSESYSSIKEKTRRVSTNSSGSVQLVNHILHRIVGANYHNDKE